MVTSVSISFIVDLFTATNLPACHCSFRFNVVTTSTRDVMKCLLPVLPSPPLTAHVPTPHPQVTMATTHKYHLRHTTQSYCMGSLMAQRGCDEGGDCRLMQTRKGVFDNSVMILTLSSTCMDANACVHMRRDHSERQLRQFKQKKKKKSSVIFYLEIGIFACTRVYPKTSGGLSRQRNKQQ
jgi:hypothetical protein